ncbi:hypothetical protein PTI97_01865 [Exiguobacterium marinum]|uniref:Uncharacterized protein n=1 Tax=Exiguobacterium marinum TaxID=273528 RepID=A0ABY7WZJ2_9BACL|nr:hypothetical protein [Exiguobacterium marinum]WDH76299.1 hypothetical protein PTI97_01865 [Exiguobacterium marinum]
MKVVNGLGWGALLLALVLTPLFAVDLLLVYLLEDTSFRILSTLAMLGCFYLLSTILSFFVDGLTGALRSFGHVNVPRLLDTILHGIVSGISLYVVLTFFPSIDLSTFTVMAILFVHLFSASLWLNREHSKEDAPLELDSIDQQIVHLLRTETTVSCVERIQEEYPDLPKRDVLKRVKKISQSTEVTEPFHGR